MPGAFDYFAGNARYCDQALVDCRWRGLGSSSRSKWSGIKLHRVRRTDHWGRGKSRVTGRSAAGAGIKAAIDHHLRMGLVVALISVFSQGGEPNAGKTIR